jgi:hypothetical protein
MAKRRRDLSAELTATPSSILPDPDGETHESVDG